MQRRMDIQCSGLEDKYSMKKITLAFLILFFTLSVPFMVCAEEEQAGQKPAKGKAAVFARIEKTVSAVKTVTSEFRQERRLAMLKEPALSGGRFYYEKPDKLRWEFADPDAFRVSCQWKTGKTMEGKR